MGKKINLQNNVTYHAEVETGWGVTFYPYDSTYVNEHNELVEDETIRDIKPILVEISEDTVSMMGREPVVEVPDADMEHLMHSFDVGGFQRHKPLWEDDTHDLRSYFFDTKEEAEKHIERTVHRFKNPQPWESFVKHDYFKYV